MEVRRRHIVSLDEAGFFSYPLPLIETPAPCALRLIPFPPPLQRLPVLPPPPGAVLFGQLARLGQIGLVVRSKPRSRRLATGTARRSNRVCPPNRMDPAAATGATWSRPFPDIALTRRAVGEVLPVFVQRRDFMFLLLNGWAARRVVVTPVLLELKRGAKNGVRISQESVHQRSCPNSGCNRRPGRLSGQRAGDSRHLGHDPNAGQPARLTVRVHDLRGRFPDVSSQESRLDGVDIPIDQQVHHALRTRAAGDVVEKY